MMNKVSIIFFLIVSIICALLAWYYCYYYFLKGVAGEYFEIRLLVLIISTLITAFLFKIFFTKEAPKRTPKNFRPFITWNYEVDFWRAFVREKYNVSLKKRMKSTAYTYLFVFVCTGMPIALIISFKQSILFMGYGIWGVIISLIGVVISEYEVFFKERTRELSIIEPTVQINSSAFVLNNQFIPLVIENSFYLSTFFKIDTLKGTPYFSYYKSKKITTANPNYSTSEDITSFKTEHFFIPIPSTKTEDVNNFIKIMEGRYKIELEGKEFLEI